MPDGEIWSVTDDGREYTVEESVLKPLSPLADALARASAEDVALLMMAILRQQREAIGTWISN